LVKKIQIVTVPGAVIRERVKIWWRVRKELPLSLRGDFIRQYNEARIALEKDQAKAKAMLVPYPLKTSPLEVLLRQGTADFVLYYDIIIQEQYGKYQVTSPVKIVIDCGANVGLSTAYFLIKYPESRVIALEPDPVNFELCQKNLRQFGQRVTLLKSAVWSETCKMFVDSSKIGTWASRVFPSSNNGNEEIDGISIGELLDKYGIKHVDILKMDIEGAEESVFLCNDLSWLKRVECIQLELHSNAGRQIVKSRLSSNGFRLVQFKEVLIGYREW
jgi:FkbM family methyltransferase